MDIIKRLENWYFSHCDNDWEHSYGVKIGTLDNPGWFVEINLTDTLLEDIPFEAVEFGDSEDRSATWLHCHKKDTVFFGYIFHNACTGYAFDSSYTCRNAAFAYKLKQTCTRCI